MSILPSDECLHQTSDDEKLENTNTSGRPLVLHRPHGTVFFAPLEIGAAQLSISDFMEHVKTGTTPSKQLRMLRAFKSDIPDEE